MEQHDLQDDLYQYMRKGFAQQEVSSYSNCIHQNYRAREYCNPIMNLLADLNYKAIFVLMHPKFI